MVHLSTMLKLHETGSRGGKKKYGIKNVFDFGSTQLADKSSSMVELNHI